MPNSTYGVYDPISRFWSNQGVNKIYEGGRANIRRKKLGLPLLLVVVHVSLRSWPASCSSSWPSFRLISVPGLTLSPSHVGSCRSLSSFWSTLPLCQCCLGPLSSSRLVCSSSLLHQELLALPAGLTKSLSLRPGWPASSVCLPSKVLRRQVLLPE